MAAQPQRESARESIPRYGGQAVIEGVMMRGRDRVAVAVRRPDGSITTHSLPLDRSEALGSLRHIPFLRGVAGLAESLLIGLRALAWSTRIAAGEANPPFDDPAIGPATAAASLGLSAALMFVAPAAGSSWLERRLGVRGGAAANLLEGAIRIGLIATYVTVVSRTREGYRLFQYHGAEHKTINAYESGAPLTPESVQRFPLEHPRCGTAFLLTVAVLNVLVGSLFGRPPFMVRLLLRLALLPVIAGIAYEFIQFSARHMDNPAVRVLVAPNLLMQRLTTREPDLAMLEVSIHALENVLKG